MLKNYKYSLFSILVSTLSNLFLLVNPALAANALELGSIGSEGVGARDGAGCEQAEYRALDRGQVLELEGAPEVLLRIERPGYLLAETYSWRSRSGDPRVVIEGVGSGGVDWLAGRLLRLEAGDYCIRSEGGSDAGLESTRLVLALSPYAPRSSGTKNEDVGDEVPDDPIDDVLFRAPGPGGFELAVKNGDVGDEVPDDPIDDVLFADPGRIPFRNALAVSGTSKTDGDVGDEVPDDPIDDVLFRAPGSGGFELATKNDDVGDEVPDDPIDDVLFRAPGSGGLELATKNDDVGDEVPDDPIDDVLLRQGPTPSTRSLADEMGLCADPAMAGSLACAADLPVGKAMVSSMSRGPSMVESYTFELRERAEMALLAEGSVTWMVLYDQSGRRIAQSFGQNGQELIETLAPGRYLVRLGTAEAGEWYSLVGGRIGS